MEQKYYEDIAIDEEGLIIRVLAETMSIPISSYLVDLQSLGVIEIVSEEMYAKSDKDPQYYQALIKGVLVDEQQLQSKIIQLVKNVRMLEKIYDR